MTFFMFLGGQSLCADTATVVIVVAIQAQSRNFGPVEQVEVCAGTWQLLLEDVRPLTSVPHLGMLLVRHPFSPVSVLGVSCSSCLPHPALKSTVTGLTT